MDESLCPSNCLRECQSSFAKTFHSLKIKNKKSKQRWNFSLLTSFLICQQNLQCTQIQMKMDPRTFNKHADMETMRKSEEAVRREEKITYHGNKFKEATPLNFKGKNMTAVTLHQIKNKLTQIFILSKLPFTTASGMLTCTANSNRGIKIMHSPRLCTVQLSILNNDGRWHTHTQVVVPKYNLFYPFHLPKCLLALLFFRLFHFWHRGNLCTQGWFLWSLLRLIPSHHLHLPNDENSGENTCQENPDGLPCRRAKVGTNALLKVRKNRHNIFSMAYTKSGKTLLKIGLMGSI